MKASFKKIKHLIWVWRTKGSLSVLTFIPMVLDHPWKKDFCLKLLNFFASVTQLRGNKSDSLKLPSFNLQTPDLNESYTITNDSDMIESTVLPILEMILYLPGQKRRATIEVSSRVWFVYFLKESDSFLSNPVIRSIYQNELKTIEISSSEELIIAGLGRSLIFYHKTGLLKKPNDR